MRNGEIYNIGTDNVIIRKLLAFLETPRDAAKLSISQNFSLCSEIITEICRQVEHPESECSKSMNLMMKARELIYEHRNSQFSLQYISDKLNIRPEYLCRSFRKSFNITPKQYHERLRIEKICTRLQEHNALIKEIAAELGFEDVSNFNKFFKKHIGFSPGEFQRRRKQIIIHDFLSEK